MNKLKNILHSWDEADTLLNKKIEKSKTEVLSETVPQEQFVAENMIPFPYQFASPYVNGNVTYTYDDNGIITAEGVDTINRFPFLNSTSNLIMLEHKKYILTGCPKGGSSTTYSINIAIGTSSTAVLRDIGNGVIIDNTTGVYDEGIRVTTFIGTTHDGSVVEFKPMIEEGTVSHAYQSYRYSRPSLEERISILEAAIIELGELVGGEG